MSFGRRGSKSPNTRPGIPRSDIMTEAVVLSELDAHAQPSEEMRAEWKRFSRMEPKDLLKYAPIDDPREPLENSGFSKKGSIPESQVTDAFARLSPGLDLRASGDAPLLYHPILPGLLIAPDVLPPPVQTTLIDRMVHRDLSNPRHQTNMHLHYSLPYPPQSPSAHASPYSQSFFSLSPESGPSFDPKDPTVHKALSVRQVLSRRLHWVTLGGQYDWTDRVYPNEEPPCFPPDIGGFLETLFPKTKAQAAIVNFYTPGDTMMMHRDVSEEVNKGLISLSLGCDCLFMIAPSGSEGKPPTGDATEAKEYLLLRLRSGDVIYMTEESRYAWHGVPKVLKGTCPDFLSHWPATDEGEFQEWKGWLSNKRINLNVRQMREQ